MARKLIISEHQLIIGAQIDTHYPSKRKVFSTCSNEWAKWILFHQSSLTHIFMPRGEPGDKTVTICICKRRDVWFCSLQPSRYRKMADFSSLLLQRRPSLITRAKAIHSTWWDKMTRVQSPIRPILGLCCHRRNITSSHPLLPWSVKCWGRAVCQRSTLLLLITAMKRNCNCLPIF